MQKNVKNKLFSGPLRKDGMFFKLTIDTFNINLFSFCTKK